MKQLKIGDKVITRRGVIGTITSYIPPSKEHILLITNEGKQYSCTIQACRKYED